MSPVIADCNVLNDFQFGPGRKPTESDCCKWLYNVCDNGYLVELNLANNQLNGRIPDSIGSLVNLQSLNLYNNQLNGAIPNTIGNLAKLTGLNLANNQLNGAIPDTIGKLANLTKLALYNNQLNGAIPDTIGKLANLTELNLANNQLNGAIPNTIDNLMNLRFLYLYNNQLNGTIPNTIGKLVNLQFLDLSNNQLNGAIPDTIGKLVNLTELNLANNQLNGAIPNTIDNLMNLWFLRLWGNQLNGQLPNLPQVCIKLKVYPTLEQQRTLRRWFGTARYVYNCTLKHVKDSPGVKYTFESLRDQFVPAKVTYKVCQSCGVEVKSNRRKLKCPGCDHDAFDTNIVANPNIQSWETETPTSARAQAINDLVKAYKTWHPKHIYIEKTLVKFKDHQLFVFPKMLGKLQLGHRTLKKWGDRFDFSKDIRLCWSKGVGYYLCVPMTKTIAPIKRDMTKVLKLRAKTALLQSLRAKHKLSNKTKVAKLFTRLGDLTDDLHWKTITYLTTQYTDILLPSFESQDMMRGFRNRSNNRNFGELKFYLFKCR
ncbi:hypothetical protein GGF32_008495, partial [Allomyces javanicus]